MQINSSEVVKHSNRILYTIKCKIKVSLIDVIKKYDFKNSESGKSIFKMTCYNAVWAIIKLN